MPAEAENCWEKGGSQQYPLLRSDVPADTEGTKETNKHVQLAMQRRTPEVAHHEKPHKKKTKSGSSKSPEIKRGADIQIQIGIN